MSTQASASLPPLDVSYEIDGQRQLALQFLQTVDGAGR